MRPSRFRGHGRLRAAFLTTVSAITVIGATVAVSAPVTGSEPLRPTSNRAQRQQLRGLLQQAQYADLDQRMNGFQQAYEARTLDEAALLREFAAFDLADPGLATNFDGWIKAFPRSYAARLARGTYYFTAGTQTRGTKFIGRTTAVQIAGMSLYFAKARTDLRDSLTLTPKPLLSYNVLIRIEMFEGANAAARSLLNAALTIDPTAMSVRRAYMHSLETRWGGSLNQMEAFMTETRKAGFSEEQLGSLQQLIDGERQWLSRHHGQQ